MRIKFIILAILMLVLISATLCVFSARLASVREASELADELSNFEFFSNAFGETESVFLRETLEDCGYSLIELKLLDLASRRIIYGIDSGRTNLRGWFPLLTEKQNWKIYAYRYTGSEGVFKVFYAKKTYNGYECTILVKRNE